MNTSYSPDCEYVDGMIVGRNVGQGEHSYTQTNVAYELKRLLSGKKGITLTEQRTRVAPDRVRIPDVCVVGKLERVTTVAPLLCVEILSPEDRWTRVVASISDYQDMGVSCTWLIDPIAKEAWIFESVTKPPVKVEDGILFSRELGIEINLADVVPPEPLV